MDAKRYRRARKHDIEIQDWYGDGSIQVNGHRGINYLVNMPRSTCTCPDWQKHRDVDGFKCKHLIKVELEADEPRYTQTVTHESSNNDASSSGTSGTNYPADWEARRVEAFERDDWACQSCGAGEGSDAPPELHAHHITPLAEGGSDDLGNLVTLCKHCHRRLHGNVTTTDAPANDSTTPAVTETTGLTPEGEALARARADSPSDQIYIPQDQFQVDDTEATGNESAGSTNRTSGSPTETERRTAEPVTGGDSETADAGLGVDLMAGLVLTVPVWVLLEGVLFLVGLHPGTAGTRFMILFVPIVLLCLATETEHEE